MENELSSEKEKIEEAIKNERPLKEVASVVFSGGTYQMEVPDGESYWIFLQCDDEGEILDQFCTCKEAEETKNCVHLESGKRVIFGGMGKPLHIRFRHSLWNVLFTLSAKRCGYGHSRIRHENDSYFVKSPEGQILFKLHAKQPGTVEKLKEWIDERKEETEETSLKFSNLDEKELERWKRGNPSESLRYELSFWSDLAKWLMVLEDAGEVFHIEFDDPEGGLPKHIKIASNKLELELIVFSGDWPTLLPAIAEYHTNLKVFEFKDIAIEKIMYDSTRSNFHLQSKILPIRENEEGDIEWDDWLFRKGIGFFSKKRDELLYQSTISKERVSEFLEKHAKLLERYLVGTPISRKLQTASYQLFFDDKGNLHIECYLFTPGDLKEGEAHFFDPWGYIPEKGFFRLTNLLFKGVEKIIPKDLMNQFIERNRLWLNKYEEFRIHLSSIETKLVYRVDEKGLHIEKDDASQDRSSDIIDFGEWVYINKQGFFSKGKSVNQSKALEPVRIETDDISDFIAKRKEDLDSVKGFFYPDSGLEKTGLIVMFDGENITVEPKYYFKAHVKDLPVRIYGDYVYIPEKGFAEIPDTLKIPEKYNHFFVVSFDQIPYFLKHELKRLKPYILHLDKKLMEPARLRLSIKHIERVGKNWMIDFHYNSSFGSVPLREVYEAMTRFSPFILSDAGMISLKEKRFHWLIRLSSGMFFENTNKLTISTLDWIRLGVFEDVHLPETDDPEMKKIFETLKMIGEEDHLGELPSIKGFNSKLRPYQEIGVRWLWFLYNFGLSGFLCDEMGLGKTHQAMALIAAIMNHKKRSERHKFLVVCPTSVAYHWQDLLQKFFHKIKVHFYHGPFRDPKRLNLKHDLILTTYGILRSDKELFTKMQFEVAIFDEMQVAKNQKSQIHSILKQVPTEMKLALTGTPIENHLLELKSLFDIVLPHYLPSSQEFKEEFIQPIEKDKDIERQKNLGLLIKPFVLRRKKQDVLSDLPEKIEEISYVELSGEQQKLYDDIALQSKNLLSEEGKDFYMHVFALLTRLKQVCDHPSLILKDKERFENHQSGKWELFVELLEEIRASGQKLVVFSQYLDMLDIIEQYLTKEKIGFAGLRGTTRNRSEEVKRFQQDPSCEVFVASLHAAGVGIDLTAASVVIHYDRWWNPAKENQATDRVHRIGQNRGVSVFKFVAKDTIEEHIHNLIEKKKDLIKNVISFDGENDLKRLDRSELMLILKKIYKNIE